MKDKDELAIVMNVRKGSTRCKNKLLRSYADTTLFDIALRKLIEIDWPHTYIGAYEEEFKERIRAFPKINIVNRTVQSASVDKGASMVFEMYSKMTQRWVFWINPCHAFLSVATIESAIGKFLQIDNLTMTSVKAYKGWFYELDGTPMNNKTRFTGVNDDDFFYVGAHAFHAYERMTPLKEDKVWDNVKGDPFICPIPPEESVDIDTEEDFIVSEALYRAKIAGGQHA